MRAATAGPDLGGGAERAGPHGYPLPYPILSPSTEIDIFFFIFLTVQILFCNTFVIQMERYYFQRIQIFFFIIIITICNEYANC